VNKKCAKLGSGMVKKPSNEDSLKNFDKDDIMEKVN
jgi:hypothetical protein